MTAARVLVTGAVQGVGFRPFILRLAATHDITGTVGNDSAGVVIEAFGDGEDLDAFIAAIGSQAPPSANIRSVHREPLIRPQEQRATTMRVATSSSSESVDEVTPDIACCPACAAEVLGEGRRADFPFNSCTDCGPRFSIAIDLPFDRPTTTMREFPLCARCQTEYENSHDRRFWAQTISCAACGPALRMDHGDRRAPAVGVAALQAARDLLDAGGVLAVKGTGGYQLMARADGQAIERIRQRKQRPTRPLAVMLPGSASSWLDADQLDILLGPDAPILIAKVPKDLALRYPDVAPGLREWGVMLPNAPLHHLLLRGYDDPFVCTSANPRGQPMVIDDRVAGAELLRFADAVLSNDRLIQHRVDDGIRRHLSGPDSIPMRRGRGQTPRTRRVKVSGDVLAVGADMKASFALLQGGRITVSQHLGDLAHLPVFEAFHEELVDWLRLYRFEPEAIVCDLHPDYVSTQFAERLSERMGVPLLRVQHHRAHVAAVLAEHDIDPDQPVVGLALDGLGYGEDATMWGGEVFRGPGADLRHAGGLTAVAAPGRDRVGMEPWLMAASHLAASGIDWRRLPAFAGIEERDLAACEAQLAAPGLATTSVGRLLDAVSFTLGVVGPRAEFDGQAPALLEALATGADDPSGFGYNIVDDGQLRRIDLTAAWREFDAMLPNEPAALLARRWHNTVISAFTDLVAELADQRVISDIVLSGGCLQNVLLRRGFESRLTAMGYSVLALEDWPTNDGSICAGQAWLGGLSRG